MRAALIVLCAGLVGLTSCAPAVIPSLHLDDLLVTPNPRASRTATPFQPSTVTSTLSPSATPLPTDTPPPTATATATTSPSPEPPTVPPVQPPHPDNRHSYILYTSLDFPSRRLVVEETIRYYNTTSTTLSELVLSVQPNRYANCFSLTTMSIDAISTAAYSLDGQRLTVELPHVLDPGAATTLTLGFILDLPQKRPEGLFGYDFNQVNLTDWYPFVVPFEGGWLLHDPMPFGEHLVYDSSDIEVNLKTDAGVVVAASAPGEPNGEWTRHRLYGGRTFAISASDEFSLAESAVGSTAIRSYYFDGYQGAGQGILNAAVQSVGLFDAKFASYPHGSLSVVQADINDGQEYDGLVFLSTIFSASTAAATAATS
jgi:hypothetical protein